MTYKISARKQFKSSICKSRRKEGRLGSDSRPILPCSGEGLFGVRRTDGVRVSKPFRPYLSFLRCHKNPNEVKVKILHERDTVGKDSQKESIPKATGNIDKEKVIQGISKEMLKSFQLPTLVEEIAAAVSADINLNPEALDALQQACSEYLDGFLREADLCKVEIVKDASSAAATSDSVPSDEGASAPTVLANETEILKNNQV